MVFTCPDPPSPSEKPCACSRRQEISSRLFFGFLNEERGCGLDRLGGSGGQALPGLLRKRGHAAFSAHRIADRLVVLPLQVGMLEEAFPVAAAENLLHDDLLPLEIEGEEGVHGVVDLGVRLQVLLPTPLLFPGISRVKLTVALDSVLLLLLRNLGVDEQLQIVQRLISCDPEMFGKLHDPQDAAVVGYRQVMSIGGFALLRFVRTNGIDGFSGNVLDLEGLGPALGDVPDLDVSPVGGEEDGGWLVERPGAGSELFVVDKVEDDGFVHDALVPHAEAVAAGRQQQVRHERTLGHHLHRTVVHGRQPLNRTHCMKIDIFPVKLLKLR